MRELGLSLDIGRCPDILVGLPHVFVTHAHLDHALGIPFYAAQRGLQRLPPGTVHIPAETVDDFAALMKLHEKLEGTTYDLNLHGMAPGDRVKLRRDLVAIAHRATHRVPANAYEFVELRHKLKPEFASFAEAELAELRRGHVSLVDESEHPILFYTGDTDRGILETTPAMFRAEVLVIECSFTLAEHRDRAERYRHIHVEDLYDFAESFENRLIVLSHFSLRYSPAEIQQYVSESCPAVLRDRIRLALADPYSRLD